MMNTTVYFNPEWMEALALLDECTRNAVVNAIVTYQITGTVPDNANSMAVFMLLKIEVDRRNRRIARDRQRRHRHRASVSGQTLQETDDKSVAQPSDNPPADTHEEPPRLPDTDVKPPQPAHHCGSVQSSDHIRPISAEREPVVRRSDASYKRTWPLNQLSDPQRWSRKIITVVDS